MDKQIIDIVGRMHALRITGQMLAKESGYNSSYVSEVLNGKRGTATTVNKLADALSRLEQQRAGKSPDTQGQGCAQTVIQSKNQALGVTPVSRLLSVDEVKSLKRDEIVWLDDVSRDGAIPCIVSAVDPKYIQFATSVKFVKAAFGTYQIRWRCWIHSEPTTDQRAATPWETEYDL